MKRYLILFILCVGVACQKTEVQGLQEMQECNPLFRNLALLELQQSFPEYFEGQSSPVTLSVTPKPVQDANGALRFLAYTLQRKGQEVATVYTYPDKTHAGVVAGVYPATQKSGMDPATRKSGMNPSACERVDLMPTPVESVTEATLDSLLTGFSATEVAAFKASMQAEQQQYKDQVAAFWACVEGIEDDLSQPIDQNLLLPLTKGGITGGTIRQDVDSFIIPRYHSEALFKTRWKGGCGPSAIANAYRGLYTHYNGVYLPIWGDPDFVQEEQPLNLRHYEGDRALYDYKNFEDPDGDGAVNLLEREWVESHSQYSDNGLYAAICDSYIYYNAYRIEGIINEWGASLPSTLASALCRITNGAYYLGATLDAHEYLRSHQLPLICLRADFHHYLCAIGSKYETWQWEKIYKLFGKSFTYKTPLVITKKWLLFTDNGTDTENNNYLPIWVEDDRDHIILHMPVVLK